MHKKEINDMMILNVTWTDVGTIVNLIKSKEDAGY